MKEIFLQYLGHPQYESFTKSAVCMGHFETEYCVGEYHLLANGPGTFQRTMLVLPRERMNPIPAVVVPFYYPEAMMGHYPGMREQKTAAVRPVDHLMEFLVKRNYACISAETYHLTYCRSERRLLDFYRWLEAANALKKDHPQWSGVGKLVADTRLLVDFLEQDKRIDSNRIGIAGHSLGGKIAFYTGCLDDRIKVILTSDFGFGWDQTNWSDPWYWGEIVELFKAQNVDHSHLLAAAAPKPFGLLGGFYDDASSEEAIRKTPGYEGKFADHLFVDIHASGHDPPMASLEKGLDFLTRFL